MKQEASGGLVFLVASIVVGLLVYFLERYNAKKRRRGRIYRVLAQAEEDLPPEPQLEDEENVQPWR